MGKDSIRKRKRKRISKFRKNLSKRQYSFPKTPVSKLMAGAKKCVYCNKETSKLLIEHMHQHAQRTQGSLQVPPKTQGGFRGASCYKCNARERETLKSMLGDRNLSTSDFQWKFFSPRFFREQAQKMKERYSPFRDTKVSRLSKVLDGSYAAELVRKLTF